MSKYILKRILFMVITFLVITFITYTIIRLAPGDFISVKTGLQGNLQQSTMNKLIAEQEKKIFGLDKPFYIGYAQWFGKFVSLDLGYSIKDGRPVLDRIKESLPLTLALNIISLIIVYIISIPLGIVTAIKKDTLFDRLSALALFILYSLPAFWVGLLLIIFFSGGEFLTLFPMQGYLSDWAENFTFWKKMANIGWHFVLPIITMVYGSFAFMSRFSRANLLEVINKQYIMTARAKGLSNRRVVFVHAFRNSLIPLVTLMASLLPGLFGGSIIIETIFSIPGMGQLGYQSVMGRDIPVIMGITAISAILTLIGIFISDILYGVVDPRIRVEA